MSELEDMINKKMSRETSIKLNRKQEEAYSYMARGENIFITGAGGSWKISID